MNSTYIRMHGATIKISRYFLNWRRVYSVRPFEYTFKKLPVPTKRATLILIKVRSCSTLLHMLLARVRSYLQSVMRYKYLNLNTYHPATVYWCEKGCEDPWLFFEAKRGPRAKRLGNTAQRNDELENVSTDKHNNMTDDRHRQLIQRNEWQIISLWSIQYVRPQMVTNQGTIYPKSHTQQSWRKIFERTFLISKISAWF